MMKMMNYTNKNILSVNKKIHYYFYLLNYNYNNNKLQEQSNI